MALTDMALRNAKPQGTRRTRCATPSLRDRGDPATKR